MAINDSWVPGPLINRLGQALKRWKEAHCDKYFTYTNGSQEELKPIPSHNGLLGQDAVEAHPVAAITGLVETLENLMTALSNKVSTVAGKGLSTEDFTTTEKNKLASLSTPFDCRTFALMTGVAPFVHYCPTARTALSAVVRPSAATTGTMTIYLYSQVVGSATVNTVATLSVPAVAANIPTTIDFTDAAIAANSQIWAECADLKSGGSVSVSVVMQ